MQHEADAGSRLLSEPGVSSFLRDDIENFNPTAYYDHFCSTFPTFMVTLAAVAVKQGVISDATLQVYFS